jgi:hypothetical protein
LAAVGPVTVQSILLRLVTSLTLLLIVPIVVQVLPPSRVISTSRVLNRVFPL